MKVLISKSFKALRVGLYVTASNDSGEFILDTEDSTGAPANATLQEIAKANKIEVAKNAKKDDLLAALEDGIEELDLPTQNEKPDTLIVEEIVIAGMKAGDDDDDMVIKIIGAGIKFKHAAKMFQHAKEKLGFTVSNKDRQISAFKILKAEKFAPSEYSQVATMADRLTNEIPDTEHQQAMGLIKRYAKEMEIELPKPEKGKGGATGGFRAKVEAHVLKNPDINEKDFVAFVVAQGKSEKNSGFMWRTIAFAQKLAKAIAANS